MEETVRYLIVGGGVTSVWAAQNIRDRDHDGSILIIGAEKYRPYDRPPLSKQLQMDDDFGPEDAASKPDNFYADNRVQLHTGVRATAIDRANRVVTLDNGNTVRYEKLLLCTGADPRELNVPGNDLKGIFYLRRVDEAMDIRNAIEHSKHAVMVGAGYIGMEVAACAMQRGVQVTLVDPSDYPWSRFASPELGGFLRRYYEERGAHFMFNEAVVGFAGSGGALTGVQTKSGQTIPADFAVVGIGVTLNTQLAKDAGLEMGDRHGVMVDEYLQTSDPNIWAAGDIACFKDIAIGRQWHAEHFLNAKYQGRAVGAVMAGEHKPYDKIPYFFSDELDLHMNLRGDPQGGKHTRVLGDLNGGEFVELYFNDDRQLRMTVAFSHDEKALDPISDTAEKLIRERASVDGITPATFGLSEPAGAQQAA